MRVFHVLCDGIEDVDVPHSICHFRKYRTLEVHDVPRFERLVQPPELVIEGARVGQVAANVAGDQVGKECAHVVADGAAPVVADQYALVPAHG